MLPIQVHASKMNQRWSLVRPLIFHLTASSWFAQIPSSRKIKYIILMLPTATFPEIQPWSVSKPRTSYLPCISGFGSPAHTLFAPDWWMAIEYILLELDYPVAREWCFVYTRQLYKINRENVITWIGTICASLFSTILTNKNLTRLKTFLRDDPR